VVIDSSMTLNTAYYSQPELLSIDDTGFSPYLGKIAELELIKFKL